MKITVKEVKEYLNLFDENMYVYIVDKNRIKSIDTIGKAIDMDTNKANCMIHICDICNNETKSDWEELADMFYPIAQKLCWTEVDSEQLLWRVRNPKWDKMDALILMNMFQQDELLKEKEWDYIVSGPFYF